MHKFTRKITIKTLVLALFLLIIAGIIGPWDAFAIPQSGHAFYGSVTTLEGNPVPYDPANPDDPAHTTMVYARDVTRELNFDDFDQFSSGEYYGRPVTLVDGNTVYGAGDVDQMFIFPAYDPNPLDPQNPPPGARPGDKIEFYICPPGCEIPGVLVTMADDSPLRAVFQIGGLTELDLSADVVFTISGNAEMEGVELRDGDDNLLATADAAGDYSFTVDYGWSGVVTPVLEGYLFIPAFRSYENVTADQFDQDYTPTFEVFTISGNAGVAGAVLHYSIVPGEPREVIADGDGNYVIEVPYGWSGDVTPELEGYEFDPAFMEYENVDHDFVDQNYTATKVLFYIYLPLIIND